jgi:hypothetical protein
VARRSELESAFETAIVQTRKCMKAGMTTMDGQDARSNLERLETELERERQRAVDGGNLDRDWVQRTVRWLVEWVPETELTLIAALGRIARASTAGIC